MNRHAMVFLTGLTVLSVPACTGADGGLGDTAESTDAPDATDAVDPGPAGCLGGSPLTRLSGVPHDTRGGGMCQESPWVGAQDLVRLPDGGWLVLGGVPLCCTDEFRAALVHLDPTGALLGSEHWEYNGLAPQGSVAESLWPLGTGGALVLKTFDPSRSWEGSLSLEAVAPDLSRSWHLSSDDLGQPATLSRLVRPGSPDLHVLATGKAPDGSAGEITLLRITPSGVVAERHVLSSALPSRGPLPDTGRWWTAGIVQESDDYEVTARFVAVEVGWDGVEGPRVEVGPFTWNRLDSGWIVAWPLDPATEGYLVWAALPGPKPEKVIQHQAWRMPLDGRAPWQVPGAMPTPQGMAFERPTRATVRADGAVVTVGNVADAEFRWRPMRVVFPATGGVPAPEGPAFDDDFAEGREWRLDGWWDLASGSLLQARVLRPGAVKPHPSQWPSQGVDTFFVRIGADGAVRWVRDYGGDIFRTPAESTLWGVDVPGSGTPWDCSMFGPSAPPPELLFFDGVCD